MADTGNQFRLNIDEFNKTYKGLDETYDNLQEGTGEALLPLLKVYPQIAGGRIVGVAVGLQAGLDRAQRASAGNMNYAMGALKNRTGHLMNGMYDSLEAYYKEDEGHSGKYNKIEGTGEDPAKGLTTSKSYTTPAPTPEDPSKLPKFKHP